MRGALGAALAALALTVPAVALAGTGHGRSKPLPARLQPPPQRLAKADATRIFLADRKVASWLRRYPQSHRTVETTFKDGVWTVKVWRGAAGEIATGTVDDRSGAVLEAWTGPQVAWKMARGGKGAFGGNEINNPSLWLAFCALFLLGLADLRRPLSLRNLSSNVIDVGYSGVVGADRIAHGRVPYGNFPIEDALKACGPAAADGEIRERVQANGRCESANPQGDTYGPVAYEAYVPGYLLLGWSGKWDDLPAAHFSSIVFDLLCLLGLALVGLRFGGLRLAATLAFAWVAYPFTQYVSSSNTNDALPPLFLIWGFWLVTSPAARGAAVALSGWTKFATLLVAPLWASYPDSRKQPRAKLAFVGAFAAATLAGFSILLLDGHPLHAVDVFWDRTLGWQVGRDSPFSIWDWRQYHAGLPDLHIVQTVLEGLLVAGAIGSYFLPRRKSPLQLAAFTAALLLGFQLVLTHWFYLYLPWFFPFAALALLAPMRAPAPVPAPQPLERRRQELVGVE